MDDQITYLTNVERLAKEAISRVIDEGAFEPFGGERATTPLQLALVDLARALRYRHFDGDGCLDHGNDTK